MGEFTGMFEFFRGAGRIYGAIKSVSQYFRALLNIFGAHFNTSGELSIFPGGTENLRAHRDKLRGHVYYFGERKNCVSSPGDQL